MTSHSKEPDHSTVRTQHKQHADKKFAVIVQRERTCENTSDYRSYQRTIYVLAICTAERKNYVLKCPVENPGSIRRSLKAMADSYLTVDCRAPVRLRGCMESFWLSKIGKMCNPRYCFIPAGVPAANPPSEYCSIVGHTLSHP